MGRITAEFERLKAAGKTGLVMYVTVGFPNLAETPALVRWLSEYSAMGDWRLFYLYRDRLKAVSAADVQRVATEYFKPANRVYGQFVPTAQPDRAEHDRQHRRKRVEQCLHIL